MSTMGGDGAPAQSGQSRDVVARDVVRVVVESQASYEMAYFSRLARFDDSWALWRLHRARGHDEALAWGPGETATLITAVVWIALNEAAREFGLAAGDGMFAGLRALLRWLLRRKPKSVTIPPLTRQQQEKVRDMVEEELKKTNLSKKAVAVANAVFWQLSKGFPSEAASDAATTAEK